MAKEGPSARDRVAPVSGGMPTRRMDLIEEAYEREWTDGLPVVPPEKALVEEVLRGNGLDGSTEIATIPPANVLLTAETAAANLVMSGGRPEYLRIVLAAIRAATNERFSLQGVLGSTHQCRPLLVINGPVRGEVRLNCGAGALGPGFRANATIGRTINLILKNVGGSVAGVTSRSVFSQPGGFTLCLGENEEASPWEPLHVARGFRPVDSTVTVYPAASPQHVYAPGATTAREVLDVVAAGMAAGGNVQLRVMGDTMVIFGPDHAKILGEAGWRRRDVQMYLYEKARAPAALVRKMVGAQYRSELRASLWPRWVDIDDDNCNVPVVRRADDIQILVGGGSGGPHSLYVSGWGSRAVTEAIGEIGS